MARWCGNPVPSHGRLSAPVVKAVGLAFILGPTLPPIQSAALETTRKCAGVIFGKNRYVLFLVKIPSHPNFQGLVLCYRANLSQSFRSDLWIWSYRRDLHGDLGAGRRAGRTETILFCTILPQFLTIRGLGSGAGSPKSQQSGWLHGQDYPLHRFSSAHWLYCTAQAAQERVQPPQWWKMRAQECPSRGCS